MSCLQKTCHFVCLVFFFLNFQANLSSSSSSSSSSFSSSSSIKQLCSHHEASALLQFKRSLSIDRTYSDDWDYCHGSGTILYPKTDSWKEGTDCCSWDGVNCDNITGQVIGLDLSCSLLYGTIPSHSSLFLLPHLQKLDLASNNFDFSTISPKFGEFASLVYLNLCCSYFSGPIPSALGNLSKVINLHMASHLEGSIPDEVSAFPNLIDLDLYFNSFNGTLPSWLYTGPSIKYIDLSYNQFSGRIKEFQYNSLIFLDLSSNEIQGPIPSSISQLLNLEYLLLDSNQLQGPIPSSISQLQNLNDLILSSNKLQGPIPSSIFQLPNLNFLGLSSNNLSGIVEFGLFSKLQNLQHLFLSSNSLALIFNDTNVDYTLPKLQDLYLSSCSVSEFPHFLRGSKRLQNLDLSNNRIYGKIPKWMRDVGKDSLIYLNLSHNFLTSIDQELPWKKIEILDLSSNLVHGDLPIPPLTTQVFFISKNSISGEIPSLICNLSSLGFLNVSHNNLSGIIPQCFRNLSKSVELLNLRMNKFHGIIPTFFKGCQLKNLNLNGNQLEGPLTSSIRKCKGLEVLDLGNNRIKGKFPRWLGSLPRLEVLVLQSSQLQGSIHDKRSTLSFSKIQNFDLSSNHFTGTLPVRYIQNFKTMISLTKSESVNQYLGLDAPQIHDFYSHSIGLVMKGQEMELVKIFNKLTSIDLSQNMFEGEISKIIGKLDSVKGLNLSHNNLSGSIPTSIGNLSSLEWLDLSSNKLNGTIPETLLDVTSLSTFNVFENQLEGQIPQGKQFNTFGNNSYEGNKGLCGFSVSKSCSNSEAPPSILPKEDGSESNVTFGWKVVLAGYGCGVVFGLAMGYVVFQTGKPKWFVSLVEGQHHKRRKASKTSNRKGRGRRM
ncbi:hypothetical protein PTKIN_Ptkin14bG0018100 [Pterospermum kingtungense]